MRITLDTGDLREVANSAAGAATQVRTVRSDVSNARNSVSLNTREDATLRRTDPDEDANRILRELDRLEGEYREISKSYDRQADAVERAAASSWRPPTIAIEFTMPSWGQLRPPSPFGVIAGGVSAITSRAVPHFVGAARSTLSSIGRTASNARQRAFGFVRSRWDNAKQRASSLFDRLKETASRAWDRVWSRTQQILRDVINGVKGIVAFSGNVITHAWDKTTTTVGRWISTGARNAWNFLGRNWNGLVERVEQIFTFVDVVVVLGAFRGVTKIFEKFKVATAFGALFAVVDFVRYGLTDARFWESAFKFAAGVAIGYAAAAATAATVFGVVVTAPVWVVAAAGSLVLGASMWAGNAFSEWAIMPHIDGYYDRKAREKESEVEESLRSLPQNQNPKVGDGADSGWLGWSAEAFRRAVQDSQDVLDQQAGQPTVMPTRDWRDVQKEYDAWAYGRFASGGVSHYQCTGWANFRWRQLGYDGDDIGGHGGQMAANAPGDLSAEPTLHAMASYRSGGYGHVMIVEEVLDGGNVIRVSEMNVGDNNYEVGRPQEYRDTKTYTRGSDGTFRAWNGNPLEFAPFPPSEGS